MTNSAKVVSSAVCVITITFSGPITHLEYLNTASCIIH